MRSVRKAFKRSSASKQQEACTGSPSESHQAAGGSSGGSLGLGALSLGETGATAGSSHTTRAASNTTASRRPTSDSYLPSPPPPSDMSFGPQPGLQAGPPRPSLPQANWPPHGLASAAPPLSSPMPYMQQAPQQQYGPPSHQQLGAPPPGHFVSPGPGHFPSPGPGQYQHSGPTGYGPAPAPYSAPPLGAMNYSPSPYPPHSRPMQQYPGTGSEWSTQQHPQHHWQASWNQNVQQSHYAPHRHFMQSSAGLYPLVGARLAIPTPPAPPGQSPGHSSVQHAGSTPHPSAEPKSEDDSATVPPIVAHRPYSEVEKAFKLADTNGHKQLELHGFDIVLMRLGLSHVLNGRICEKFQRADQDKSGTLSFEEVLRLVPEVLADAIFARIAANAGKCELAPGEMHEALALVGIELGKEETYRIVMQYDRNSNYTISHDEFLTIFAVALHRHPLGLDRMLNFFRSNVRTSRTPSTPGTPVPISRADAEAAFRKALPNTKGELGICAFGKALDELGIVSGTGMFKKFAEADKDGNKAISLREFISFFDGTVQ